MMEKKAFKIGEGSTAVVIPKAWCVVLGFAPGVLLRLEPDTSEKTILISKVDRK